MVDQYYFKNYRLFKIPFKTLLAYHCPLGNSIKYWTNHLMMSHILAIRNDLQILNLSFTIIQLRKALNSLFNKILYRGSFLIYAEASNSLKIEHNSTFTFVNQWLPGLISNYKQLIKSLTFNKKAYSFYGAAFFKRPQLDALATSKTNPVLKPYAILHPRRRSRYGRVPSISLSVMDSSIWLNECHNLNIPSIQLCDSQSAYDKVTYPIVSNQRSVPYTQLIINLFSEACNYALLFEHLHFVFFFRQLQVITRYKKELFKLPYWKVLVRRLLLEAKKHQKKRKKRFYFKKKLNVKIPTNLGKLFLNNIDASTKMLLNRSFIQMQRLVSKRYRKRIINKNTFVFNKRFFSYQIRDFFKNTTTIKPLKGKINLHKKFKKKAKLKRRVRKLKD